MGKIIILNQLENKGKIQQKHICNIKFIKITDWTCRNKF